jgi:hypothetical protein
MPGFLFHAYPLFLFPFSVFCRRFTFPDGFFRQRKKPLFPKTAFSDPEIKVSLSQASHFAPLTGSDRRRTVLTISETAKTVSYSPLSLLYSIIFWYARQ